MRAIAWPTVGRADQLRALSDAVARAIEGAGSVVTVEAPAGAGKTQLLDEAAASADASGVAVRRARVPVGGVAAPFAAPLAAFGTSLAELDGGEGAPRSLLEAAAGPVGTPVAVDRLLRMVEDAAGHGPLVLVLDDLHRADAGTVSWVEQLAPRVSALPLVLVLASRPPAPDVPLDRVWHDVVAAATRIELPPLDDESVAELAALVLDAPPGPRARRVLAATGNLPLLVTALLESIVEGRLAGPGDGVVDISAATEERLTARAPQVVVERVREITGDARQPLLAAAVLGDPFPPGLVAQVLGEAAGGVIAALERTERSGLLVEEGTRYRFRHDLYRQAVLASASPPVLAALHGEAATVCAAAGERPLVVAEHLLASGVGGEDGVTWLVAAAESVVAFEPTTALSLVEHALTLTREPDRRLTTAHLRALASVGRVAESEALARQMLATADTPFEEMGLRRDLAMALFHQGRPAESLAEMNTAAALVPPGPARNRLRAEAAFAQLLTTDFAGAGVVAEDAARQARIDGDLTTEVAADMVLCLVRLYDDRHAEALALADHLEHLAGLAETSDAQLYQPWFAASLARLETDDLDGARRAAGEGQRRCVDAGYQWMVPAYDALTALAALRAGDLDDCAASARAALDWRIEDRMGAALWCHSFLARVAVHAGDLDVARTHVAEADRLVAAGRAQLGWDHLALAHAGVSEAEGDRDGALTALTLVWQLHDALGAHSALQELGPRIVRLARLTDRLDAVDGVVAHVAHVREKVGTPTAAADHEWALGWRDADPDALGRAVAHQERTPRRLTVGILRAQQAELLHLCGREAEALDVASQARRDLEACGAHADAAALAHLAGDGMRRSSAAVTGPDALSRSERRVVMMIAEGLANADIAEALFVSRRTVESHVSAAYRKLGVGNRVELARIGMDLAEV